MASEKVGLATWEELTENEKLNLVEIKIWESNVYNEWIEKKQENNKTVVKNSKKRKNKEPLASE
jgi:hypothetical protein